MGVGTNEGAGVNEEWKKREQEITEMYSGGPLPLLNCPCGGPMRIIPGKGLWHMHIVNVVDGRVVPTANAEDFTEWEKELGWQ